MSTESTPYYSDDMATIYNGDARNLLNDLDFDVAFTSPPYNMHLSLDSKKGTYSKRSFSEASQPDRNSVITNKYSSYSDDLSIDDYFELSVDVIDKLLTKARIVFWNVQLVTGNKPAIFRLMGHYEKNLKEVIIWNKPGSAPSSNPNVLHSMYEFIFILTSEEDSKSRGFEHFKRGKIRGSGGLGNLLTISPRSGQKIKHGASMPVELSTTLLDTFTIEGDVVIDPFMGSGTTLRSALDLGRKSIGIDIDSSYCDLAISRVAQQVLAL